MRLVRSSPLVNGKGGKKEHLEMPEGERPGCGEGSENDQLSCGCARDGPSKEETNPLCTERQRRSSVQGEWGWGSSAPLGTLEQGQESRPCTKAWFGGDPRGVRAALGDTHSLPIPVRAGGAHISF